MILKLTEVQLNNLMLFLERVDLKGNEVPAYVDIVNIINNASPEEKDKESKDTQ